MKNFKLHMLTSTPSPSKAFKELFVDPSNHGKLK